MGRDRLPFLPPPSHFVPADPVPDDLDLGGTAVWWRDNLKVRPGCTRWSFVPKPWGLSLTNTATSAVGGGTYQVVTFYNLPGPPYRKQYAPGFDCRWTKPGRDDSGVMPACGSAIGAIWPFSVVAVTDDRIDWVEATSVAAYHPDDAHHWYRSRAACEASGPTSR